MTMPMTIRPSTDNGGAALDISLLPLDRIDGLARIWTDLESRANGSFFLSWLWIGQWLAQLPPNTHPHLLVARKNGEVVGLAVLCPRVLWRFGILRTRCWMLHETGKRVFDRLFVEYNGILADRRCADAVTTACLHWLGERFTRSDELILGGLTDAAESAVRRVAAQTGHAVQVRRADTTLWVDLDRVRAGGGNYRAGLGKNTRAAVNRTERLYRERGALEYRIAGTVAEALADFAALEILHQASWQARGEIGAFANPAFRPFHERLIAAGVPSGAIRICRISVGEQAIGYLYNLVHRNRVMNYQGGFAFESDNRLKPGLLSHVLAIEDSLRRGEGCYDFMSTPAGHKPLLANTEQPMNWLALGPDRLSRRLDARWRQARGVLADTVKRSMRGWFAPAKGS